MISDVAFTLALTAAVVAVALAGLDYWETGRLIVSAPLVILAVLIVFLMWVSWSW